jgi:ribonucleotide reductase alpha subunit
LAAILDLPFTSSEFKQINKNIAEVIYFNAIQASRDYYKYYLTVDVGFEEKIVNQTPLVKEGKLHFDLETTETFIPKQEWQSLLSEVKKGVSNSLLVCYMPTASTSILLGCNEAFEPFQDLLFSRVTILGEFTIFNKYLVQDLIRYNVWNDKIRLEIISNESIQNINFGLPLEIEKRLKEKYLTIWELKQKDLIDMAADRQLFTDQSQSMNLYWKEGDANKIINALIYGWSKGLKTGVYYTRVKPQTSSDKKLAFKTIKEVVKKNDNFECFGCSA